MLLFSALGLFFVFLLMTDLRDTIGFAKLIWRQLLVGYLAIILVIETLGFRLLTYLIKLWAGPVFAYLLLLLGGAVGSSMTMIIERNYDLHSYVFIPLLYLGFFGLIPALIIGLIGSFVLRQEFKRLVQRPT